MPKPVNGKTSMAMIQKYDQCYRFNSGRTLTSNSTTILRSYYPGTIYGLKLEFYFETKNQDFGQVAILIRNHTKPLPLLYGFADVISAG